METEEKTGPSRSLIVLIAVILIFAFGVYLVSTTQEMPDVEDPDLHMIEEPELEPAGEEVPSVEAISPSPDADDSGEPEPPKATLPNPASVSPPEPPLAERVSASAYKGVVPTGGALLTGGWEGKDGARTFTLVQPERVDGHTNQVMFSSRVFAIPADKLDDPTWQQMLPDENSLQLKGATYTAEELAAFTANYQHELSRILSSPRIVTLYGQAATIQISSDTAGFWLSAIAENDPEGIAVGISLLDWEGGKLPGVE